MKARISKPEIRNTLDAVLLKRQRRNYALGIVGCLVASAIFIPMSISELVSDATFVGVNKGGLWPGQPNFGSNGFFTFFAFTSLLLALIYALKVRHLSALLAYVRKLAKTQQTDRPPVK